MMRKLFGSMFGVVNGGVHPREIAVAVILGTLAGFVTGWNLTLPVIAVCDVLLTWKCLTGFRALRRRIPGAVDQGEPK